MRSKILLFVFIGVAAACAGGGVLAAQLEAESSAHHADRNIGVDDPGPAEWGSPFAEGFDQAPMSLPSQTGYALNEDGDPVRIEYGIANGMAVVGGDMIFARADEMPSTPEEALSRQFRGEFVLSDAPIAEGYTRSPVANPRGQRSKTVGPGQSWRWPNGLMPYAFANNLLDERKVAMQKAIDHYNTYTPFTGLRLRPKIASDTAYVLIQNGGGNSADVGYEAGRVNDLFIDVSSPGATLWQMGVHELGHSIGFSHEHQRCDRDGWLTLTGSDVADITTKYCASNGNQAFGEYNLMSIMHYNQGEMDSLITKNNPGTRLKIKPSYVYYDGSAETLIKKSVVFGLAPTDLRSIGTMYASSQNSFAIATMLGNNVLAFAWNTLCDAGGVSTQCAITQHWANLGAQLFNYDQPSGRIKNPGGQCVTAYFANTASIYSGQLALRPCDDSSGQVWDIPKMSGAISLRNYQDAYGRPLCLDMQRTNLVQAKIIVIGCSRRASQQWRRFGTTASGGNVATGLAARTQLVTELIPKGVAGRPQAMLCMGWIGDTNATPSNVKATLQQCAFDGSYTVGVRWPWVIDRWAGDATGNLGAVTYSIERQCSPLCNDGNWLCLDAGALVVGTELTTKLCDGSTRQTFYPPGTRAGSIYTVYSNDPSSALCIEPKGQTDTTSQTVALGAPLVLGQCNDLLNDRGLGEQRAGRRWSMLPNL